MSFTLLPLEQSHKNGMSCTEHTRNRQIRGACLLFVSPIRLIRMRLFTLFCSLLGYQEVSIARILSHQLCPWCVGGAAVQRSETNSGHDVSYDLKLFTVQGGLHAMISP